MGRRGARLVVAAVAVVAGAGLLTGAGFAPPPATAGSPGTGTLASSGGWGNAEKVAGLAAHFKNELWTAAFNSLSCTSPGNCGAGGFYKPTPPGSARLTDTTAFVVSQINGRWGSAVIVPGITALSTGGGSKVTSLSCARGGCAAVGYYTDAAKHVQGFVTDLQHGRWQRAMKVPGLAALNAGEHAVVNSVSCPLAGVCAAGGSFTDYKGDVQGFVVNERHGQWQPAVEVPSLGAVNAVRCASAGNCAAVGQNGGEPSVVSERNDVWSSAIEVPGIQAINTGDNASATAVSCPSVGNCAAAGYYYDNNYDGPFPNPWAVNEKNGHWGNAVSLAAHAGGTGYIGPGAVLSCPSPGNCTAGGFGLGNTDPEPPWLISQHNGTWGTPLQIPATAASGAVTSVSCPSAGNCTAVGWYQPGSGGGTAWPALLVSESLGHWGKPQQVPGITALNLGQGSYTLDFVSCPLAGSCTAVGTYRGPHYNTRPFVISQVK